MKLTVLSATDVRAAMSMEAAVDVMEKAFAQLAGGSADVPLRGRIDSGRGTTLLMPAFLKETRDLAVKLVSIYPANPEKSSAATEITLTLN